MDTMPAIPKVYKENIELSNVLTSLQKEVDEARIIAEKYDLVVQPVLIIGTRKILDSQNLKQQSGKVKVIYLPSIKAERNSSWYKDMEENMRERLALELKNDL